MAVNVATLTAKLDADIRDFDRDMKRANKQLNRVEGNTKKASKGLGGMKTAMLAVASSVVIAGLAKAAKQVTMLAVDAEEAGSAFKTVFGPAVGNASKFVEEFANQAGFAEFELQQLMATTGNIVQGIGATEEESAKLAESMARLAGDVASFSNAAGGAPAVLKALQSGLTGETEALKTYGIVINQADIAQRALLTTGKESADQLTRLEKANATLAIAYERSGKAVGDLDRTSDGAANTMRRLEGMFKDVQVEIGEALIPTLELILPVVESIIPALSNLADGFWWVVHVGTVFAAVFSDQAKTASDVQVAIRDMNQAAAAGGDVLKVYTERLVDSAKWGRLTTDAVGLLSKATRADATETAKATSAALSQVKAFDSETVSLATLIKRYGNVNRAEEEYARLQNEAQSQAAALTESIVKQAAALEESGDLTLAQIEALFGVGIAFEVADMKARDMHRANMAAAASVVAVTESSVEMAAAIKTVATAVGNATDVLRGYAKALKEQSSPVFAALSAYERYLAVIEDTEATELELALAILDVGEAFETLSTDQVETAILTIATALGKTNEEARALLESAGLLDGMTIAMRFQVGSLLGQPGFVPEGAAPPGGTVASPIPPSADVLPERGFASGGIVGGPIGAPQLAMVHGGETILPTHKEDAGGITVNVTVQDNYNDPAAARRIVREIAEAYEDYKIETVR